MKSRIRIHKAKKDLEKLDKDTQKRVIDALKQMISDKGRVDLKKLKGTDKWRLRVGAHRVILKINEDGQVTIYALRILHRREAYRSV